MSAKGQQIIKKPPAQQVVVQSDGGRGHFADENRPEVGAIGVPVIQGENSVEFPAGGVEVAGTGVEPGGNGVCVCWSAYPPAHRLCRHVPQFCWLVAGADDFGLIYFPDQQAALTGMLRALRPGGRISAVVYSTAERNGFFAVPVGIIRRRAQLPPPAPGQPGPFSFGGPGVIHRALAEFEGPDGFVGPCEMLVISATR